MNVSKTTQDSLQGVAISVLLLGAAVLSQGCAGAGPLSTSHGDSVRNTMALQVVNPTPAEPNRVVAGAEGVATKHVVDGYVKSFERDAGDEAPVIFTFGGLK